jgi:serine O-acetyltransferase
MQLDSPLQTSQVQDPSAGDRNSSEAIGLWAQIVEDWNTHDRDWSKPGFRAVAVHRFGVWRNTLKWKLVRAPLSFLYRRLYRHVRNNYGIEILYTVQLGRRVLIEHQGRIVIHAKSVIGDDCVLRQGVTLGVRRPPIQEAPHLGRRVSVGAGAKILGAVTIGDDAAIGANAVVLCDVPAGCIAVGVPARILSRTSSSEAQ